MNRTALALALALLTPAAARAATVTLSAQPVATNVISTDDVIINATNSGAGTWTTKRATVATLAAGLAPIIAADATNAATYQAQLATNDLNTALAAKIGNATNDVNTALAAKVGNATNDLNTGLAAKVGNATNDLNTGLAVTIGNATNDLNTGLAVTIGRATNDLNTGILAGLKLEELFYQGTRLMYTTDAGLELEAGFSYGGSGALLTEIPYTAIADPPWVEGGLELAWGNGLTVITQANVVTVSTPPYVVLSNTPAPVAYFYTNSYMYFHTNANDHAWLWVTNCGTAAANGLYRVEADDPQSSVSWTNAQGLVTFTTDTEPGVVFQSAADPFPSWYEVADTFGITTLPYLGDLTWTTQAAGTAPAPDAARMFYGTMTNDVSVILGFTFDGRTYTNGQAVLWVSNATPYITAMGTNQIYTRRLSQ